MNIKLKLKFASKKLLFLIFFLLKNEINKYLKISKLNKNY